MKKFCEISPREVGVASLSLDPTNPRLRLHPGGTSEKELIERLCRLGSQSPSQVVKHLLADHGYLNNEIPVVYKAPGKSQKIIIDGNRRVAALKMVNDPTLIPNLRRGLRSDCEKLKGLVPNKIRYWYTTSISDAKRIVYRAHNEGSREWETLARYATHFDFFMEGQSIQEIADMTGSQKTETRDQINAWLLYNSMMIGIPNFQIEDDGITNFRRITTSYPAFAKKLGIGLDSEGVYQMPDDEEVVNVIHRAYLASAKTKRFTRDFANNEEARSRFWKTVLPKGLEKKTSGRQVQRIALAKNNGEPLGPSSQVDSGNLPSSASSRSHSAQSAVEALPSDRQVLSLKRNVGKKAHAIFTEYCRLPPGDFPVASAALTRAMIETTLKHHAKRLGCYTETSDQRLQGRSDLLDNVAVKLKKKIASLKLDYSSDLLGAITNCTKQISELNDVMHKDGAFSARPAVKSSVAALAAAVEDLIRIPSPK